MNTFGEANFSFEDHGGGDKNNKKEVIEMVVRKVVFVVILGILFLASSVFAWGPCWGGGYWWGAALWNNSTSYPSIYNQITGVVTQIQTLPGPGRRGFPWIVIEVKDANGKTYQLGLGPQWWGTPPELKQGVKVSITTFYPPGWQYRGVPYSLACSISFPDVGKHYSLRPCGWWRNSRFPTKNSK